MGGKMEARDGMLVPALKPDVEELLIIAYKMELYLAS